MRKLKATLLSTLVMVSLSLLLVTLISFILSKSQTLPQPIVPLLVTLVSCVSVVAGSFCASSFMKEKGILMGLISAAIYITLIVLYTYLICKAEFSYAIIGKSSALLICGAIGGILGVNRKNKVQF